jgi:TRAP-type C4-dicarboxylate transport system permease small subunit
MTQTNEPKVLGDDGQFHATDAPIDLSIYGWEDWISFGFFLLLALDIFYQFFTRYVLSDSAAWTEEIARYLLIIIVFLGGSMAVRKNTHIHVEFVFRYLPAPVARVLSTGVDVVRVAFLAYATYLACLLVPKMHNLSMTVINFPMSYVYGFVAAGFALMTMRAVQVSITHWRQGWSTLERPMEGIEV